GLLGSARERFELLALELQEEKLRFIQLFVWVSAAIFSAMLAITFASIAIVYAFWETSRMAVLVGFAVLYGGAFAALLLQCRKILRRQPRPFEGTLAELQQDRACIRPEN
ncbi:MAG TPA: phage holin family protein, partial [Opitutus sp.]|nr:phage holin family protein [Opitutus sp.]